MRVSVGGARIALTVSQDVGVALSGSPFDLTPHDDLATLFD
jgi:hypothetical protein